MHDSVGHGSVVYARAHRWRILAPPVRDGSKLIGVLIGAVTGLLLLAPGALAATWGTGVEASLPAGAGSDPDVTMTALSCASAGNCGAVGGYEDGSSNNQGLVLTQTAGTWAPGVEVTPPAGAGSNPAVQLNSVSCPSVGNCAAVGGYDDGSSNNQGLLLTESSGTWGSAVKATVPAGADTDPGVALNSVSCASAGNCTAVGSYDDSSFSGQGLLLTESSGTWGDGVEATLPAGAGSDPSVALSSVSCSSAGNCSAVGSYVDSSGREQGLLLEQSSGTWATGVEATPPSGTGSNPDVLLSSVSCASAGNCAAVGTYSDDSSNAEGLLLTDSSGTWATGVEATLPTGAGSNPQVALSSVSCPSAGNCAAGGNYVDGSGDAQGLLLTESSGTWASGVSATLPANAGSPAGVTLSSVSCASVGTCSVAGEYRDASAHLQGLLIGSPGAPVVSAAPTVSGSAQQGQTLTEAHGSWSNSPTSFGYQWEDCDSAGSDCSAITGATSQTYVLLGTDVGDTIRVVEKATNAGGSATATTAQTAVVAPLAPSNTALPTISGTAQEGQTLTEAHGAWSRSPTSFTYQWEDCDSAGNGCSAISGATAQTYVAAAGDVGDTIRVVETAANAGGSAIATSDATTAVVVGPPVNLTPPTITGTGRQGTTLTASPGTWASGPTSPTGFSYQWEICYQTYSCDVASGEAHTVQADEEGDSYRLLETATGPGGTTTAASTLAAWQPESDPPTAEVISPLYGAIYAQNSNLTALFECYPGGNGGVLESGAAGCHADLYQGQTPVLTNVVGGQELDTAPIPADTIPDAYILGVTATDTDGQSTTYAAYYQTQPPSGTVATGSTTTVLLGCNVEIGCVFALKLATDGMRDLFAVDATAAVKHKKPTALQLASKKVRLAHGQLKNVEISLNRTGKRLLAKLHRLKVTLTITENGHVASHRTIVFKSKPPKKRKL